MHFSSPVAMPPCPSGPAENLQELDFPWAISHACGAMCVPQANVIIWVPLPGSSGSQRVPVIFSRLHKHFHACRTSTTAIMMMMMGGLNQKRPRVSLGQVWDQPLGPILATKHYHLRIDTQMGAALHPRLSPHLFTPCCIGFPSPAPRVSNPHPFPQQFPSLSAALAKLTFAP